MSNYQKAKSSFIATLSDLMTGSGVDLEVLSQRLDYLTNLARVETAHDLLERMSDDPLQEEATIREYMREIGVES